MQLINLKNSLLFTAGIIVASMGSTAVAAEYKLDPSHSFIQFSISHLGFSLLQGRFNQMSGHFSFDEKKPSAASIQVEVQTASVDSNHAERDKHIRDDRFLDVEKYPTAKFISSRFSTVSDGKHLLEGDFTLHGVTKNISIDVEFIGAGKDPWGGYRRGYVGTTTIKRSDYNISHNLGPLAESMELKFFIEGIRQ